jgi:hypothetical protein
MKFKTGDKVRIINREPSNTTGTPQWYSDNNSIGVECYLCLNDMNSHALRSNKDGTGEYYGLLSFNHLSIFFNECDLELVTEEISYEVY